MVRELGKVFGVPKEEIDQLAVIVNLDDKIQQQILRYVKLIESFSNKLSIHPAAC